LYPRRNNGVCAREEMKAFYRRQARRLQILKAFSRHDCHYSKVPPRQHGPAIKSKYRGMGSEIIVLGIGFKLQDFFPAAHGLPDKKIPQGRAT
jgi:hypothetical protein